MRSSVKSNQAAEAEYVNQKFSYALGKLSNKGYSLNKRVFRLNSHHLSYFSKVPKVFENNKATDLPKVKPKANLKLQKITAIQTILEEETTENKKLKGQHDKTIKIIFHRQNGISKNETDSEGEADASKSDNDERRASVSVQRTKIATNGKPPATKQWILFCANMRDRNTIIS